jgi:hypothetical protein
MNKLLIIIVLFLLGLLFCSCISHKDLIESFESNETSCPDMLIQKGAKIYLYNSQKAEVPGVNPIEFQNLEEYTEFFEWQKSQGINCPVLFLQKVYDPQGKSQYRIRPSPLDNQGGLPTVNKYVEETMLLDASHDDKPFNEKSHPGYDAMGLYNGEHTPLDTLHDIGKHNPNKNPNAMDTNWNPNTATSGLNDLKHSTMYGTYESKRVNSYN